MKNKGTSLSKHAPKRTEAEKEHDRELAVRLSNQGFTHVEIADYIYNLTGRELSPRMVGYDIQHVREDWANTAVENYNLYVQEELARLKSIEQELWQSWRASKGDVTQERVEKVARAVRDEHEGADDEALVQIMVDRIITTTQQSVGEVRFLELILKVQAERRKLLGLYAPARLDIREQKTVNVKAYTDKASPSDWPGHHDNVVEGELLP